MRFQYRRESGEEVVRGLDFGRGLAEAVRACHQDQRTHPQACALRQHARVDQQQHWNEDVCEVIDDVVEAGTVEVGQQFFDTQRACQQAIGGVDDDLQAKPQKGAAIVPLDDIQRRGERDCGTKARVRMCEPWGHLLISLQL